MAVAHSLSSLMYQICQFLNPFVFFSGVQRVGYRYFYPVRFHFFSFRFPRHCSQRASSRHFSCPSKFFRRTPSTNLAVAVSYRLNYFVLVLLFCFADKKNDIKTSCPKSKVEILLLVRVLSPLYVYVKDMGKHQWIAGQPFMWIGFRPGLSLHSQVSYCHIGLLNNIQKN